MTETTYPRFIYFVRHGESEGNVATRVQSPTEPLTVRGREQAAFVGKRFFRDVPVEHIVASTMTRAMQTAEIIAAELSFKKEIEHIDFLGERHPASEFIGLERSDEKYKAYDSEVIKNWANPDWHYSDEEGFFALRARAQKVLSHIETLPYGHTVVVTHGLFLRFIIGEIIHGNSFTPEVSNGLIRGMRTQNTGITASEYDPNNLNRGWMLLTYNDYAHLPK